MPDTEQKSEELGGYYVNWPKDKDGLFLADLPVKFVELEDFENLLKYIKKNRTRFFRWYPGKTNPKTLQNYPRPLLQHLIDTLPRVTFSRTDRFPINAIRVNLTKGDLVKDWNHLQRIIRYTEGRFNSQFLSIDQHVALGKLGEEKSQACIDKLLFILHDLKRPSRYAGVCTFRRFEATHTWKPNEN